MRLYTKKKMIGYHNQPFFSACYVETLLQVKEKREDDIK